jgi:hypothetical protein
METASLSALSPNTIMYSFSDTFKDLKIEIVATGSIADINHPNWNDSIKKNGNAVIDVP